MLTFVPFLGNPDSIAALEASGESLFDDLTRHLPGDRGEVDSGNVRETEPSVKHGWRLLSAYTLKSGTEIWVITEADRYSKCLCLPQ